MGRVEIDAESVERVVRDLRTLAAANREKYEETDGEEGSLLAESVYEDAANHIEEELLGVAPEDSPTITVK